MALYKGLQAGFGASIAGELPALRTLHVAGVRIDCQGLDTETTTTLTREIQTAGLIPMVIISDPLQIVQLRNVDVELLNEPDLKLVSPADYRSLLRATMDVATPREIRVWAGSISNLNEHGLGYLRSLEPYQWPPEARVSVHRYPTGRDHLTPHDGFYNREAEVVQLKTLIGNRPWGVTEFGYHTAWRWWWGAWWQFWPKRWSDLDVARMVSWEWQFWQEQGATFAVLYQLYDGATSQDADHYGIRTMTGVWKPVAQTF